MTTSQRPEGRIAGRIDGWKAIGAHFGRDRTTVMRWARERGLPVKRIPGGKTGTVYALKDELDTWAAGQTGLHDDTAPTASSGTPAETLLTRHRWKLAGGAAAIAALAVVVVIVALSPPKPSPARLLPSDPAVSALYLKARDDWALRTPPSLDRAIAGLEVITQRDPTFAPAWAGLADAYLLSREFGTLSDNQAFPKARAAADKALQLDATLADAHRADGFILYWWEEKPRAAGKAFRRALDLAPDSAQTHFWYGNILSDNGQHVAALRELNIARLREPGSVAIQTDLAWAQWSAGDDNTARTSLVELARTHPDFAVIHDCLRAIYLADGDYVGYAQSLSDYARVTHNAELTAFAGQVRAALKVGASDVHRLLLAHTLAEIRSGVRRNHRWPVFLASIAQDRKQTIVLLQEADRRHEVWGGAGVTARISRLWISDAEITDLIRRRKPESVE